jgi:hypothetical protein
MATLRHLSVACSCALLTCVLAVSVASGRARPVYIGSACPDCAARPLFEHPGTVVVGLDSEIHKIHWTQWGARTTTGRGTFLAGTGVSEPGMLVASKPLGCGGREVYSRLSWRTPVDKTPAGKPFSARLLFNRSRCEFVAG